MSSQTQFNNTKQTCKVTVFGATGGVGKHFVRQALASGHQLCVLVRDAAKIEKQPNLKVIVGEATKIEDVQKAMVDADVVVSCLGNVGGNKHMNLFFENILTTAKSQPKVPRCFMITSHGLGGTSPLVKWLLTLMAGKDAMTDYEKADQRVRSESQMPCLLVRPAALTNGQGSGKYNASENKKKIFLRPIPRADVAQFLVDALTNKQWDGKPGIQLAGAKK